jgi:folate-dependent phosphoribosylglycinamide formyltransferase PurN
MILPRIAVLASGKGTTLQSITETYNIVFVISNNRDSNSLRKARQFGVPGIFVGETEQT